VPQRLRFDAASMPFRCHFPTRAHVSMPFSPSVCVPCARAQLVDAVQAAQLGDAVAYYRAFASYAHGTPEDEMVLETLAEVRGGQ
jgi:hypothetical protein